MRLETHGRWPLVGAAAVLPVTAYAITNRRARPLAALLWHQTEEWVWPGRFLPWINRGVLGSYDEEFPIDRRAGFFINVGFGWGLSALALVAKDAPAPAAALYVSHLSNASFHVGWAIKHRASDPGLYTAVATLLPVGVIGLHELIRDESVSRKQLAVGVATGVVLSAGLAPYMKLKLRRWRKVRPEVMKWFDLKWRWGGLSDAEHESRIPDYYTHLDSITSRLPAALQEFEHELPDGGFRTIHDAHLDDWSDNTPVSFILTWICGTGAPPYKYERLTVEYTGNVELFGPPSDELGPLLDDRRSEFIYHELEVLDDGRIEHRHALSSNRDFGIRFSDATVSAAPATSEEYHAAHQLS